MGVREMNHQCSPPPSSTKALNPKLLQGFCPRSSLQVALGYKTHAGPSPVKHKSQPHSEAPQFKNGVTFPGYLSACAWMHRCATISRAAVIPSIPAGSSITFTWNNGTQGRYVNVFLPGYKKILTLCEVEVYGYPAPDGENVALRGKATQSALFGNGFAYNAIDGNRDGIFVHGSCTHTEGHLNPWWRVDLLQKYKVFSVVITNTVDNIPTRLNGAEIRIGNSLDKNGINNPRCAVISSIPAGFSETFECNGMEGRYVTVVIPGRKEHLTLCEVEVYGSPLD